METRIIARGKIMQGLLAAVAVGATVTATAFSQALDPPKTEADSKQLTWEVISVKPNHTLNSSSSMTTASAGLVVQNMTLMSIFINAFDLTSDDQIVGLPAWVKSDHFDIQAKMDVDSANALKKMKDEDQTGQWHSLFRQILENRFALHYHIEKQVRPVYNLVIAKQGPKLKEAVSDEQYTTTMGPGRFSGHRCPISSLVFGLTGFNGEAVDRIVIDRTDLTGSYDIDLTWSTESEPDSGPSIFTAIQKQLGLKLEPGKATVDVVAIDHIERPSED